MGYVRRVAMTRTRLKGRTPGVEDRRPTCNTRPQEGPTLHPEAPTSLGRPHPRSRRLLRTQYEENAAQAPIVENPSAMQETRVRSLGQEDSLEEGMATHSSILAWRIPWTEKPGGLQSIESHRVGHD